MSYTTYFDAVDISKKKELDTLTEYNNESIPLTVFLAIVGLSLSVPELATLGGIRKFESNNSFISRFRFPSW
jgi:hypothetical protein